MLYSLLSAPSCFGVLFPNASGFQIEHFLKTIFFLPNNNMNSFQCMSFQVAF